MDETHAAKAHAEKISADDPDVLVLKGSLAYKEGDFEGAKKRFLEALNYSGGEPHIMYNLALCYYSTKQFQDSLKYIQEIIEKGITEHPELSVGTATEVFHFSFFSFANQRISKNFFCRVTKLDLSGTHQPSKKLL